MIKFKELSMRNFLSYGNNTTKIKLDFNKPTLVVGKNYDSVVNGQVDSNGAGKSAILNAIAFCLYDKTVSGIDKSEVVNYTNGKNMEISLSFEKDGSFYKIERYRKNKPKGGDGVRVFINKDGYDFTEEHDKTPDSIANANRFIESVLGIPFEIFSRIVVFNAQYEPFLSLPSSHASKANQRDIIEELFGLTELSRKAELLKEKISSTKQKMKTESDRISYLEAERSRTLAQLDSIEKRMDSWELDKKEELKSIKSELKDLLKVQTDDIRDALSEIDVIRRESDSISESISRLHNVIRDASNNNKKVTQWEESTKAEILELQEQLSDLLRVDVEYLKGVRASVDELSGKINEVKRELSGAKTERKALESSLKNIIEEISQLDDSKCPYCKQAFHDSENKRLECVAAKDELDAKTSELDSAIEELSKKYSEYEDALSPLLKIKIPDLESIGTKIKVTESKLETLKLSVNPYTLVDTMPFEGEIMDLNMELERCSRDLDSKNDKIFTFFMPSPYDSGKLSVSVLERIDAKIESLSERYEILKKSKNPHSETYREVKELLDTTLPAADTTELDTLDKELTHQEFLLKLLTKKDSFVRKALLNKNIPYLNSRLSHYLNVIGLEHKVMFNEEMGVTIKKFGTEYGFNNLSAGQKARVNLALSFAFRDVLQARFEKINFCILDECLDTGLGNVGVQLAAKMVKTVATEDKLSMLVISHKDEIASMFDSRLEVELKRGFSNVLPGPLSLSEDNEEDDVE